jgi:hypothetical protein
MGSGSRNTGEVGVITAKTDFTEVIVDTELQEFIRRGSDGPAIGGMMLNMEVASLGKLLEFAVVVGVATAAILHAVQVVPVVAHFMEQGSHNIFNGP